MTEQQRSGPDPTLKPTGVPMRRTLHWRTMRDDGYLQEANRQFFHPLGLALAVTVADDGETGTLSILDARDDPEGFSFVQGDDLLKKAERVSRIATARHDARIGGLGYWLQPIYGVTGLEGAEQLPRDDEKPEAGRKTGD